LIIAPVENSSFISVGLVDSQSPKADFMLPR